MINFWVRPDDKQYIGPPVVHVSAPSSARHREREELYTTKLAHNLNPRGAHSQYLEGMINELREDFANMRANFGLQLVQQGSDIRELKTMVGQLLQHHKQQGMDVVLYFIRKRIDSNFGLFPSNVIIADCFFWACWRYNKHVVRDPHVDEDMEQFEQNIDWASEMNDTPFSEYYTGKMQLGSSSWAHKDIVYIPVNNNGAHWLTAKVDIPSWHITLYDSAIKMTPKSWFQIKNASPLAVLFPYLLMVNEYYSHHPNQMLDLTPFKMTREEDSSLPQQISDGDCGVYALKYIEYLVARSPFDFNSSHIALFREKYAVEIFHNDM
ncbi:hypothetical protein FNV43_RR13482 [Rhamnella rubrinervis]|uniref:Ubiquitin-like protease family profile domain-containing protein n=1 Tax=Rhamnella rubrinervis TaxID=2594499 RepID=A0A8K0H150_9ROSA|nr:hypothetical protein FNV43_RR13482 [Rhamnella rubrinervis]